MRTLQARRVDSTSRDSVARSTASLPKRRSQLRSFSYSILKLMTCCKSGLYQNRLKAVNAKEFGIKPFQPLALNKSFLRLKEKISKLTSKGLNRQNHFKFPSTPCLRLKRAKKTSAYRTLFVSILISFFPVAGWRWQ